MRVEKISKNKVKIYVSYEDLEARGIEKEEMWQNGKKVQELFWDMMEVAYSEVGFEIVGPIAVEAFTMPTEGVIVIVTQVPSLPPQSNELEEEEEDTEDLELDPFSSVVFEFHDFEAVIQVSKMLYPFEGIHASLYVYNQKYHLVFENGSIEEELYDTVWAVLHEYGDLASLTTAMIEEYGKCVINNNAFQVLLEYFA